MPNLNLDNIFTYHAPKGDQTERYQRLREAAKHFAEVAQECVPDSRERSTGLTNVQQATMWFNAAIAINE